MALHPPSSPDKRLPNQPPDANLPPRRYAAMKAIAPQSNPSRRPFLLLLVWSAFLPIAPVLLAKPSKEELRATKREASAVEPGAKPKKRDAGSDARDAKPKAVEAQSRALEKIREHLDVPDDMEWSVIADRIAKVEELRRSLWSNAPGNRGTALFGDKDRRASTDGSSSQPERDALRSAVREQMTDAEIKARLVRAHEVQRQNEVRLAKAQDDLRAVLSIRQEAVAVVAGLLPP
jgi:hypothetical protein